MCLARVDAVVERTDNLLHWNGGVWAMREVDVDIIHSETPERVIEPFDDAINVCW